MTDLGPVLFVLAAQITLPLAGGLLLSRRRDPAAACRPLAAAVGAVLVLTPLVFLPLPVWPPSAASPATVIETAAPLESAAAPLASPTPRGVNILDLLQLAKPTSAETLSAGPDVWSVVACAAVALAAFGLVRLALSWIAVVRVVRRSRPVTDPSLLAMADELRHQMGCRRPLALHESAAVGSAATVGWFRPVVLLYPGWQEWTPEETRAVLAHEIAHAGRGDFVSRFVARLAAALHSYHPLVRWAASRLELRQEMAADAQAAGACGGRLAYLRCLAALALKADAAPVGPLPTFLSRPRTLLRRIAMLRVKDDTVTRSRRWPALAGVGLLAVAALGLHGATPEALADPTPPVATAHDRARPPLDVSFLLPSGNRDEAGVYAIRIDELTRTPGLEEFVDQYQSILNLPFGKDKKLHFGLADVEQIGGQVFLHHEPKIPSPNRSLMLSLTSIRMVKTFDWVSQLREWCTEWKEHTHAGTTYYSGTMQIPLLPKDTKYGFYLPDDRTLVVDKMENIKLLVAASGKPTPPVWAKDWKAIEGGVFGLVLTDTKKTAGRKDLLLADDADATEKRFGLAVGEILSKSDQVLVGFDIGRTCVLKMTVNSPTAEDGNAADKSCAELVRWAEEERKAATEAGKEFHAKTSLVIRRGVDFEPAFRHQTGIQIEFKGGMADLVKAITDLMGEKK
jgi:beta-lactamase regulating signal transducer with metallopeptidase domain